MSNVCMICGNAECDCRMHSECFSRGDTPDDFAEDRRVCEGGRGIMSDDEARWGEHRRVCRAAGVKVNGRAVAALARIEELEAENKRLRKAVGDMKVEIKALYRRLDGRTP